MADTQAGRTTELLVVQGCQGLYLSLESTLEQQLATFRQLAASGPLKLPPQRAATQVSCSCKALAPPHAGSVMSWCLQVAAEEVSPEEAAQEAGLDAELEASRSQILQVDPGHAVSIASHSGGPLICSGRARDTC